MCRPQGTISLHYGDVEWRELYGGSCLLATEHPVRFENLIHELVVRDGRKPNKTGIYMLGKGRRN